MTRRHTMEYWQQMASLYHNQPDEDDSRTRRGDALDYLALHYRPLLEELCATAEISAELALKVISSGMQAYRYDDSPGEAITLARECHWGLDKFNYCPTDGKRRTCLCREFTCQRQEHIAGPDGKALCGQPRWLPPDGGTCPYCQARQQDTAPTEPANPHNIGEDAEATMPVPDRT